jgi:hypothetical protein
VAHRRSKQTFGGGGLNNVRFFTMAWWGGDHKGDDPIPAYTSHLDAIRDRLPPDLLVTQESFTLHDTRLRELRLSLNSRTLNIVLETYAGDAHLTLLYSEVDRFESFAAPRFSWAALADMVISATAR